MNTTTGMLKFLFTGLLLTILNVSGVQAKEFFVSLKGFGSNAGTVDRPFKTLQKASDQIAPGDTVTIRGGVYVLDAQFRPRGGDQGKWVVYSLMPDEKVVVDGSEIYMVKEGERFQYFSRTTHRSGMEPYNLNCQIQNKNKK